MELEGDAASRLLGMQSGSSPCAALKLSAVPCAAVPEPQWALSGCEYIFELTIFTTNCILCNSYAIKLSLRG